MTLDGFRLGQGHPIQILLVEPLFEEANRMRRTLAQVMRRLDAAGIGSAIPDLHGTGESVSNIRDASLGQWRKDVANATRALSQKPAHVLVASFRGGALIDGEASARAWWRCAPETGHRIIRDLRRASLASDASQPINQLAGHELSGSLISELESAIPASVSPLHVVRLESDTAEADSRIVGGPLWRRAEPGEDLTLTTSISENLIDWARRCANG